MDWTIQISVGARDFPLFQNVQADSNYYPASCSMGTRMYILRSKMKQPGHEADLILPFSTEVKSG